MIRRQVAAALAAAIFGIAAAGVYGLEEDNPWTALAAVSMIAAAAFAVGGILGFVFGIPRTPSRADDDNMPTRAFYANTNLEQISDWLTKILVGVGLTQLGTIAAMSGRLVDAIAPAVGGGDAGKVFAGALVIYFVVIGFVLGWLLTRMSLGPALSLVDRNALRRFVAAEEAEHVGDTAKAARLRERALASIRQAQRTAVDYESVRMRPVSHSRTVEMERLIGLARDSAASGTWSAGQARSLFDTGTDGNRIFALGLMEGDPTLGDFDAALDAITRSRSAFEQSHGLRAIATLVPTLSDPQRRRLRSAIAEQIADSGHLKVGTSRRNIAVAIMDEIAEARDTATRAEPPEHS